MSSVRYSANAQKIVQYYIRLLAAPSIGSIYYVTCNGKTFSYTAVSATAADEAALLVAAFNAQTTIPELQEVYASITSGANIKFESRVAGKAITLTFPAPGGVGSPTFASVSTQANSSPSDISLTTNWSAGALPSAADSVFIQSLTIPLLYGLDQVTNALALVDIAKTMTAQIGLPEYVTGNTYKEYRTPRYWEVKSSIFNIGTGEGSSKGSSLLMINGLTTATTINIFCTPKGLNGRPAVQFLAVNVANIANVTNGSLGIAMAGDEVSTFATVTLSDELGPASFESGPGLTLTTMTIVGRCSAVMGTSPTNLYMNASPKGAGGTCVIKKGNISILGIDAGTLIYQGQGAAATMGSGGNPVVLGEKAILDLGQGSGTVTIANGLYMRAGSKLYDPLNRLTGTTITFYGCSPHEVTIIRGQGSTLATA